MIFPYPFFAGAAGLARLSAGALAGFACGGVAPPVRGGAISATNRESKSLHSGVLVVLLRFLDFDLLEVAGPLQRGNEVRHGIDRSRRAFHG